MYDYFVGTLVEKGPMHCVLDVGSDGRSIGYAFTVSLPCSTGFTVGDTTKLFAHLHVREIEQKLFGFSSREERSMFHLLLTVSGVGPGLAIKLLSGCPHEELRRVIQTEDLVRLKKVRGVGAKTAQRIIVDLKDTISALLASQTEARQAAEPDGPPVPTHILEDALLALLALGYPRATAEKALQKARNEGPFDRADAWVREALRQL